MTSHALRAANRGAWLAGVRAGPRPSSGTLQHVAASTEDAPARSAVEAPPLSPPSPRSLRLSKPSLRPPSRSPRPPSRPPWPPVRSPRANTMTHDAPARVVPPPRARGPTANPSSLASSVLTSFRDASFQNHGTGGPRVWNRQHQHHNNDNDVVGSSGNGGTFASGERNGSTRAGSNFQHPRNATRQHQMRQNTGRTGQWKHREPSDHRHSEYSRSSFDGNDRRAGRFRAQEKGPGAMRQAKAHDWFSSASRTRALENISTTSVATAPADLATHGSNSFLQAAIEDHQLFAGGSFDAVNHLMPERHWAAPYVTGLTHALANNSHIRCGDKHRIVVDTVQVLSKFDSSSTSTGGAPQLSSASEVDMEDTSDELQQLFAQA